MLTQTNVQLAERLALMGSRGMQRYLPDSHETVTEDEGASVATRATELLQSVYGLERAQVRYDLTERYGGYIFTGNHMASSRQMPISHRGTLRITGGPRW